MKNNYFIILLFTTFSFQCFSLENMVVKIAGKHYSFIQREQLLVNKDCTMKCIAYERTLKISKFKIKEQRQQFEMPLGSYVCKKIIMGSSVLGVGSNKDMKAFCYFEEDNSMIELNSLAKYAEKFLNK